MTDLDTLRRALHTPEDGGDPIDIPAIIKRGRRLRRRRILTVVAAGAFAVGAVFGAVTGITHLTRPSPAPGLNPADSTRPGPSSPARGYPSPYLTPSPSPSRLATPASVSPTSVPSPSDSALQPTTIASPTATGHPSASPTGQPSGSPSAAQPTGSTTDSGQPSSPTATASQTPSPSSTR
jgi:hypothetical protein